MKIQNECVPCLFKRILFEANESTSDNNKIDEALKAAAKAFVEIYSHNTCSADIATKVHEAVYTALEDFDPYKKLKESSNEIAISLIPEVKKAIASSEDPLKMSILCSIVGNSLDFGIDGGSSHPEMFINQFQDYVSEGFGYDDVSLVKQYLKNSNHILYFTDNCGEIVFDKLVCEQIKNQYPNITITLVVKGTPILSDATRKDAKKLKFEDIVDEIIDTGIFAVGMDFKNIPKKLDEKLKICDFIICKGMANYEVFSEQSYHPITYFLRSKCQPISSSMGVDIHKNIVKIYP